MAGTVDPHRDATERLRLIAAGLAATGLSARLHETSAGTDLAATLHPTGQRELEVVIDEDGYTEIRYWANLNGTPHQAVATLALVLSTITTIEGLYAPRETADEASETEEGYDGPIARRAGEQGMSGSGDQLAGYERSPDSARPPEQDSPHDSRSQPADLQARLERLPVGHPSSPYRDDGTRKPPPPDLRNFELDLPDEQPPDPDPDQDLATEDQARLDPDGSWHWKGLDLNSDQSRSADQTLAKCREAEKHLTPAMRRVEVQIDQGHLVPETEKFALKEPDRFKEKFAKATQDEPDSSPSEILSRINDGVRYTFIFEDEQYAAGVTSLGSLLETAGFESYERKNSWADDTKFYQGVNSTWIDRRSRQLFEVQIHTPASWQAKQESHKPYEIVESKNSTAEERAAAEKQQELIFRNVPIPPNVEDISSYRKEGW